MSGRKLTANVIALSCILHKSQVSYTGTMNIIIFIFVWAYLTCEMPHLPGWENLSKCHIRKACPPIQSTERYNDPQHKKFHKELSPK